jgi:hypothetical protein
VTGEPYRSPGSIPPEPAKEEQAQVDEATRLGLLRSVHPSPPLWRVLLPEAIVPLVVLVAVVAGLGKRLELLPIGVGFAAACFVIVAWGPFRRRGLRLEVHAHGVVVATARSRDAIVFEDVDALFYELNVSSMGPKVARIRGARLVRHDGTVHRIPLEVVDGGIVFQWIVKHCSDALFPDAQVALRAGETLTFGDVRIDREGIAFGKGATVPWSEIQLARMQPGSIALFKRARLVPWRTIHLSSVPHPTLFARLFRELASNVEVDDPLTAPPPR